MKRKKYFEQYYLNKIKNNPQKMEKRRTHAKEYMRQKRDEMPQMPTLDKEA